jgi:hypothetical protein
MPKQVKLRRGTTAQHAAFTGALGEVTVDTTKKTVVVHDGATPGGSPLSVESAFAVKIGKTVWVDKTNGNDGTAQRGRVDLPYLTLGAAKTAAQSGDTIIVGPGTYDEKNLLKDGVNWHFLNGAKVAYTGSAAGGIFDTSANGSNGAVTSRITGDGEFSLANVTSSGHVIHSSAASSDLIINGRKMSSADPTIKIATPSGSCEVNVTTVTCTAGDAIQQTGNSTANTVRAQQIDSSGGNGVRLSAGNLDVISYKISSSAAQAVYASGGGGTITAHIISSSANNAVEYNNPYNAILTIRHARIVSTLVSTAGRAIYIATGTSGIKLVNCTLVANATAPAATTSIDALAAATVHLHGESVANIAKGANVTVAVSALTVNAAVV